MAELLGIAGADEERTRRTLRRMEQHIGETAGRHVDRRVGAGLGCLRFHHGAVLGGEQPVQSDDGDLLLLLDGVCSADPSGRRPSSGHGDGGSIPRTVLSRYQLRGEAAFRELSGSYNILLYRPAEGRVLLVTDRLGTRPMYWALCGGSLLFGTRFNALLACPELSGRTLNFRALTQFLTLGHCLGAETFLREVRAVEPAGVLEFSDGRAELRRYWRMRYDKEEKAGDLREWAGRLAAGLRRAARRLESTPGRVGLLLSGGLDSRTALAAMEDRHSAYTVAGGNCREVKIARRVAEVRGWRHQFIRRPVDYYFETLPLAVELAGGMERYDHCHFAGLLAPAARRCDVLLHEDAMDPLFKGYYWRGRWPVRGIRVPLPIDLRLEAGRAGEQIIRHGLKSMHFSSPWEVLREPWRSRFQEALRAGVQELAEDADTDNPYHVAEHVAGLAAYGRTAFCAANVRTVVEPAALGHDKDLLELALRMPVCYRRRGRALRAALRLLDGRLYALPEARTGLRPDVPAVPAWAAVLGDGLRVALLRKLGLLPPTWREEGWPDRSQQLRKPAFRRLLEELTSDEGAFPPDLFRRTQLRRVVEEHLSGRRYHFPFLHCLVTFGTWFRGNGPSEVE